MREPKKGTHEKEAEVAKTTAFKYEAHLFNYNHEIGPQLVKSELGGCDSLWYSFINDAIEHLSNEFIFPPFVS